jgi:sulfoxide reductase catalytic subunit YedY
MRIRVKRGWELSDGQATPEDAVLDRRKFIRAAGAGLAGLAWAGAVAEEPRAGTKADGARNPTDPAPGDPAAKPAEPAGKGPYPAARNPRYTIDRPLTDERAVTRYNNFYEFSFRKDAVWRLAQRLVASPWALEVKGLCAKPGTFDVDDLVKTMPLEERLYRFRCVEAWAMAVPWTGFPLSKLLDRVEPLASAKYVRFVTFHKPEWGPSFAFTEYPWPYFEGLSMEEARNELAILATGLFGKPLPKQNGAPIRLVVPWKYGFKSIKSIVRIELVAERPPTFWNQVIPDEYDFVANVDPAVPHPRWSQAEERMIDTGEMRKTLPYNGYGEWVAGMYKA